MATHREGEPNEVHFRTERFFTIADKWYFMTREGFEGGPYANKARAETGLKKFLHTAKQLPGNSRNI